MRKSEDIVGGISKDIFQSKNYFVEMGYLFVINQGSHAIRVVMSLGSKSCDNHVGIMWPMSQLLTILRR